MGVNVEFVHQGARLVEWSSLRKRFRKRHFLRAISRRGERAVRSMKAVVRSVLCHHRFHFFLGYIVAISGRACRHAIVDALASSIAPLRRANQHPSTHIRHR